jgi:hypothetical protein
MADRSPAWPQFNLGRLLFAILVICIYLAFRPFALTPARIVLAAVGIGAVSAVYIGLFAGCRYSSLADRIHATTRWGGIGAFVASLVLSVLLSRSIGWEKAAPWIMRHMIVLSILAAIAGAITGSLIGLLCQAMIGRQPPPREGHPLD